MKMNSLFALIAISVLPGCSLGYSPIIDGALSELEIEVVDDEGSAVADARVDVLYYVTPEKVEVDSGRTDDSGHFRSNGRTIGEIQVAVQKDGYYNSRLEPDFRLESVENASQLRRWSVEPVKVAITLKRIKEPAKLILFWQELSYPATNVALGLDLALFDWCAPYGNGRYDDLQVRYEAWAAQDDRHKFYSHFTMTMTNGVDGFYFAPVDEFSQLRKCYRADTNAIWIHRFEGVCDRRTGTVDRYIQFPETQYIVFRTRTRTNDAGEVVSANYGVIAEKGRYNNGHKLSIFTGFNPLPNDTNLESIEVPRR